MGKSKLRPDILLIGGLFLAGLILLALVMATRQQGAGVEVSVAGEVQGTFDLNQNGTYTIEGAEGGTNDLVIENGEAWLSDASCPDKLCVGMGKIHYDGESIICLPNKVVIRIRNGEENEELDFITGGQH